MVTKKQILKEVQDLSNLVKGKEFEKLKKDSEELQKINSLLANIKFKVKDIKYYEEDEAVKITYELPKIVLYLDENGKVANKNDFFYSTNMLELISLEDMMKIQDFLRKLEK